MDKCNGIFGWLFGHAYKPVITKGIPHIKLQGVKYDSQSVIRIIDKFRPETFNGLYCKRCGKMIDG